MLFARLLLLMFAAHALCDYPLQGDFLVRAKRGVIEGCPAWLGLAAHSIIHAGAILLITDSLALSLAELAAHFIIDRCKCQNKFGLVEDQALHLTCKLVWCTCFVLGWR